MIDRRKFLRAALFVAAAPVIVKASSLMPIRAPRLVYPPFEPLEYTEPSVYLRELLESIGYAPANYFGFTKLHYVNGKIVVTNVPPAEVELSFA